MKRAFLQRLAMCLTVAVALLLALPARAAFVPACEARAVATLLPPPDPSFILADDAEEQIAAACLLAAAQSDIDTSKVPALCDARGASMVAPPRILPVSNARIDAARSCDALTSSPIAGPSSHDSPGPDSSPAMIDGAVLTGLPAIAPAEGTLLPISGESDEPRAGFAHGIERPPR